MSNSTFGPLLLIVLRLNNAVLLLVHLGLYDDAPARWCTCNIICAWISAGWVRPELAPVF